MANSRINVDLLPDAEYKQLLLPVWEYLAMDAKIQHSDVIFVFGGLGMEVPAHAANLFKDGFADKVLISGASGPLTRGVFGKPEADVFKDEMVNQGVPISAILTESRATNAGQNVEFGMQALQNAKIQISSAILVAKSFIMRRCVATFEKQFPDIRVIPSSPRGSPLDFIDRTRAEFAQRMIAEIQRLKDYGAKGFIVTQEIPNHVIEASEKISAILSE